MEGIDAARAFIGTYYPDCLAALLFGSVARGEATPNSDLDIFIVARQDIPFYRKSFRDYGWFIEAFVGSQQFSEKKIRRPHKNHSSSLLLTYAEGIILKDSNNFALSLKEKAVAILKQGPDALTQQEIDRYRYIITDWLDDLMDSKSYKESLFIVYDLVAKAAELLLAHNRRWIGERKWLYRALQELDHQLAERLIEGAEQFYQTQEKGKLVEVIEAILEPVGGRLYEGYSRIG